MTATGVVSIALLGSFFFFNFVNCVTVVIEFLLGPRQITQNTPGIPNGDNRDKNITNQEESDTEDAPPHWSIAGYKFGLNV